MNSFENLVEIKTKKKRLREKLPLTIIAIYKKITKHISLNEIKVTTTIIQEKGMYYVSLVDANGAEKLKIVFLKGIEGGFRCVEENTKVLMFPFNVKRKEDLANIEKVIYSRL